MEIADAIITALRGPRGPEIARMVVARATEMSKIKPPRTVDLGEMLLVVATEMGVTADDMRGRGRRRSVTNARGVFAYLAREYSNATMMEIGEALGGQDHSTISTSVCRGLKLITTDEQASKAVEAVEAWNIRTVQGLW
jgi:chromosomal replication initiation ATPase DnaA